MTSPGTPPPEKDPGSWVPHAGLLRTLVTRSIWACESTAFFLPCPLFSFRQERPVRAGQEAGQCCRPGPRLGHTSRPFVRHSQLIRADECGSVQGFDLEEERGRECQLPFFFPRLRWAQRLSLGKEQGLQGWPLKGATPRGTGAEGGLSHQPRRGPLATSRGEPRVTGWQKSLSVQPPPS